MSRIGKQPIPLPGGVKVEIKGQAVGVTGPKGQLSYTAPRLVQVALEGSEVRVSRSDDSNQARALHGLARALLANMVRGVTQGYEEKLEIYGTGYSVRKHGNNLLLNIGFMGRGFEKPAQFPAGLQVDVEAQAARGENDPARFTVRGIDKQLVGQFAAEVRKLRKPEPYKGKGIRYAGEKIRRKAGKVFAGGGG